MASVNLTFIFASGQHHSARKRLVNETFKAHGVSIGPIQLNNHTATVQTWNLASCEGIMSGVSTIISYFQLGNTSHDVLPVSCNNTKYRESISGDARTGFMAPELFAIWYLATDFRLSMVLACFALFILDPSLMRKRYERYDEIGEIESDESDKSDDKSDDEVTGNETESPAQDQATVERDKRESLKALIRKKESLGQEDRTLEKELELAETAISQLEAKEKEVVDQYDTESKQTNVESAGEQENDLAREESPLQCCRSLLLFETHIRPRQLMRRPSSVQSGFCGNQTLRGPGMLLCRAPETR